MKVAYLVPNLDGIGGIAKVLIKKANYLAENLQYQVSIITYSNSNRPSFYKVNKNVKIINLKINETKSDNFFLKKYKNTLEEFLLSEPHDFTFSIMSEADYFFLPSLKDRSFKIAEYHTSFQVMRGFNNIRSNPIKSIKEKIKLRKFIKVAKLYEAFIVLTEEDASSWKKYLNNVVVLPNPITIDSNAYLTSNNKTINEAIAVGRLEGVKDYKSMIEIWEKVVEKHSDWILKIYGSGSQYNTLKNIIKEKKLDENIKLFSPIEEIETAFLQSSFHLLTSQFEGFALVILEAMSLGIPSVSFNCKSGPSELIDNNISGFLVDKGDKKLFTEKVLLLIENEKLRKEMGTKAKIKSQDYEFGKIMSKFNNLLKKIKASDS